MNLYESVKKELKESYDMYNVVEDLTYRITLLRDQINTGVYKDLESISKELDSILKKAEENVHEAW